MSIIKDIFIPKIKILQYNKRIFKIIEINDEEILLGNITISRKASPSDAAKKLLLSIAHYKGYTKQDKKNMDKVTFLIQEFTENSKQKVYGPYQGYYYSYNEEELKKAQIKNGSQLFKMKPVVKLFKS